MLLELVGFVLIRSEFKKMVIRMKVEVFILKKGYCNYFLIDVYILVFILL